MTTVRGGRRELRSKGSSNGRGSSRPGGLGSSARSFPKTGTRKNLTLTFLTAPRCRCFIAGFDASQPFEDAVTLKAGQRFPNATADEAAVPTDLTSDRSASATPGSSPRGR